MKCERGSWFVQGLIICLALVISHGNLQADAIDESSLLQSVFDEALLDLHGGRWSPAMEENLQKAREQFGQTLTNPEARELWNQPFPVAVEGLPFAAEAIGFMQARLQHFGVGAGVEVAPVFALDHFAELARVGEIAVVREADSVRRVHVERLGFRGVVAAGGRVADMAHAHVALELLHVVLLEHVAHQALALADEQLAVLDGRDARGILTAVLEHRQRVIDALVDPLVPTIPAIPHIRFRSSG